MTTNASSQGTPMILSEVVERYPKVLGAEASDAYQAGALAGVDAVRALAAARARFLKSAESFLPPCLQEAVLANLARADPLAPPTFDPDVPNQTEALAIRKRKLDEKQARVRTDVSVLNEGDRRAEEQRTLLCERLHELSRRVDASSHASGLSVVDVKLDETEASEADRRNDQKLRENAEFLELAQTRKAELATKIAALQDGLSSLDRDIERLEKEQTAAATAAVSSTSAMEASKQAEVVAGVVDMTDEELEEAVAKEKDLVKRNADISEWYQATVASLERVGGVRISSRKMSGMDRDREVGEGGLELTIELQDFGQVMEVALSAADGSLGSVQMFAFQGDDRVQGVLTQSDVEELASHADALPAPGNLRLLVSEALSRSKCAALRDEHVRLMRRRYLVGYRAGPREVTITMPAGIVASFRLHPDYPMIAGGAEILALTGVGGWSASETEQLCGRVNALALASLMDVMDRLQEGVAELDRSG